MSHPKRCWACGRASLLRVASLRGSRTGIRAPLYICTSCRSAYQRPGYREDDGALREDLGWHLAKLTTHADQARELIQQMLELRPHARTLLDVGCGVGTTVAAAQGLGLSAIGVEPNPYAQQHAVEVLQLDVLPGCYRAEEFPTPFDLVILDNVLEHIEEPRAMLEDVLARVAPEGLLYVAVPANRGGLARLAFSLLWQRSRFSIFRDNDVHINHFTAAGIARMAADCGAVIRKQLGPGRFLIGLASAGGTNANAQPDERWGV